jgi:hypothetical protein
LTAPLILYREARESKSLPKLGRHLAAFWKNSTITGGDSMQTHLSLLSSAAVTLGTALLMGASAIAADLPKEGAFSGTTVGNGTYKAIPVGKERLLLVFNDSDATTGDGLFDHTISNCFGLGDFTKGVGHSHGYCVVTDASGDKIVWIGSTRSTL